MRSFIHTTHVVHPASPPSPPPLSFLSCRLLEAAEKGETGEGRLARVAKEIQALEYVGRRSAEANGRRERGREGVKFRKGRGGEAQAVAVAMSRQDDGDPKSIISVVLLLFHTAAETGVPQWN